MKRDIARDAYRLFLEDAARWLNPGAVSPTADLTPKFVVSMLVRQPSLRAMAWFRVAAASHLAGVRGVPSWVQRRLLRLYGLELMPSVPTGGGLYIAHPVGCVLMAESIGSNVSVISLVTFGMRNEPRWPRIGDGVFLGAGARVLGGISVGAGATVGANSVVIHDVDPGVTVVGAPALPVGTTSSAGRPS